MKETTSDVRKHKKMLTGESTTFHLPDNVNREPKRHTPMPNA